MIDIHTHILPELDDGSSDLDSSINQLRIMADSGVTSVFLTPHYIPNFYPTSKKTILDKLLMVQELVTQDKIPISLEVGTEIFLEANSIDFVESEKLNMGNSRYLLVETNMSGFAADFNDNLFKLLRAGYKPILAHPERYLDIQKNPELAEDLMHRNVYMQINAGSLLGQYGKLVKKTAWTLLHQGWAHFLASDNHCRSDKYPLEKAFKLVASKIDNYTAELLTEINPQKIIENDKINMFYLENSEKKESFISRFKNSFS